MHGILYIVRGRNPSPCATNGLQERWHCTERISASNEDDQQGEIPQVQCAKGPKPHIAGGLTNVVTVNDEEATC